VIADILKVSPGQRALDVACGTGVLGRHFAGRTGVADRVHGVDVNDGMLKVAESKAPGIHWQQSPGESLPFDDNTFDCVGCQFGLMFFENRILAIQEMIRVLKPGGKLAVAVWDTLDNTPGYLSMTELLQQLFGDAVANELHAPYALGDKNKLEALFNEAGVSRFKILTKQGVARFQSIYDWVFTDIKGWTLADMIDDQQFETLMSAAERTLQQYTDTSGAVCFSAPAHIVEVRKT
jgi:ubiquinone/menaquinone biosynthesis C-methylase UbiE